MVFKGFWRMQNMQIAQFSKFSGFSSDIWYLEIVVDSNSRWPTQNGACREREFHIFSRYSAFLFDIRNLGAFQIAIITNLFSFKRCTITKQHFINYNLNRQIKNLNLYFKIMSIKGVVRYFFF